MRVSGGGVVLLVAAAPVGGRDAGDRGWRDGAGDWTRDVSIVSSMYRLPALGGTLCAFWAHFSSAIAKERKQWGSVRTCGKFVR